MLNARQLRNFQKYKTDNPAVEYDLVQKIASNPKYLNSKYVANCTDVSAERSCRIWKTEWFLTTDLQPFETIEMPIPGRGVDLRLKTQYGDYLKYPPIEQRGQWHSNVIWDPDRKYNEYL